MFFSILLSNWKMVLFVGLMITILGLGTVIQIQKASANNLKDKISVQKEALNGCAERNKILVVQLDNQNQAIDKWKREADRQKVRVVSAEKRILLIQKTFGDNIETFEKQVVQLNLQTIACKESITRKDGSRWANEQWQKLQE